METINSFQLLLFLFQNFVLKKYHKLLKEFVYEIFKYFHANIPMRKENNPILKEIVKRYPY